MDGFYFAFVAVGAAMFWLSTRPGQRVTGPLLIAWILLGGSLCTGIILLGGIQAMIAFNGVRDLVLGAAVIFTGFGTADYAAASKRVRELDSQANANALDALKSADLQEE